MACNYQVAFARRTPVERAGALPGGAGREPRVSKTPGSPCSSDDDGQTTYYGTYTAFDGANIAPQLIQTDDFRLRDHPLTGPAAKNKGMAIFPRRVGGRFLALSRWDRESIGIASSPDAPAWGDAVTIQTPEQPWEVIQLGNCGPPIETDAGWLVLTHGVGPMRAYAIGAILLDLDDPTS